MSQAEELLNSMSEEVPVHTHPVPDTDTYFVIDPVTRKIENTNPKKHVIMQYDHNSERCTFELPRFIDGHDMLECTSVTVNVDNIEVVESDGIEEAEPVEPRINSDAPDMTDLRIHPNDPDKVISSWLISRNSTQLAGILSFHIEYKCVDANGNVVYEWSTDNYDEYEIRARKKNGEAAVAPHADLLEQWRTRIFGAGDSVMANIAAEGEAQVAAVKAESETQQEAVELKGAQTLDSIPEGYVETNNTADEAVRSKGDAIVCEAEGAMISITDTSNDYIRGLHVYGKTTQVVTTGKNLFDKDINNLTLIDKTERPHYGYELKLPAGTYTVSCANPYNAYIYVSVYNGTTIGETVYLVLPTELRTGTFVLSDSDTLYIYNAVNVDYGLGGESTTKATFNACQIQVEAGDKVTSYEPYSNGIPSPSPAYPQELTSVDAPIVNVCGKNILNNQAIDKTANGITYTVNADKSVTINGTSTSSVFLDLDATSPIGLAGTELTASLGGNGDVIMNVGYFDADGYVNDCIAAVAADEQTFAYPFDAVRMRVYMFVGSGKTFNNVTVYPMIRLATKTDNSYEPYTGSTIAVANTLPGIPVVSGGNYTDSDGQQWICDEIDLERGVYVQRCKNYQITGNETWREYTPSSGILQHCFRIAQRDMLDIGHSRYKDSSGLLCNRLPYGGYIAENLPTSIGISEGSYIYLRFDGETDSITTVDELKALIVDMSSNDESIEVLYPLATPIETPLTAEEIVAFKALRTNYPNTTILNDAGAWMSVKYNADTKSYVDNPKTLRLTDTSTGVVYELKVVDGNLTVVPIQ